MLFLRKPEARRLSLKSTDKNPGNRAPYKIMLADDHQVLRFGMRSLLSREDEFEVVGEAENGRELLEKLESIACDLIVLDLSMPELDGLKALELIKKNFPEIKVLIFSMHKEREFFKTALSRGVNGYILKDDDLSKIPIAIKDIRDGRKYFSPELTSFIVEDYSRSHDNISLELLTRRELEVLKYIAKGASSREIAEDLAISHRTVQTHRSNIMEKLGIKKATGLVKFALENGIL